jgi:hypothetical protein
VHTVGLELIEVLQREVLPIEHGDVGSIGDDLDERTVVRVRRRQRVVRHRARQHRRDPQHGLVAHGVGHRSDGDRGIGVMDGGVDRVLGAELEDPAPSGRGHRLPVRVDRVERGGAGLDDERAAPEPGVDDGVDAASRVRRLELS